MEKIHLVSSNLKTDWSINFSIQKTCQPTPLCRDKCYARKGRLAMTASLDRQEQVYQIFRHEDSWRIAHEIGEGYHRKGLTFLRWCGSGDMFPDSCSVLNKVASQYPDSIHWVVTRKPSVVSLIDTLPNIYLMFSLDSTETSRRRKQVVDRMAHSRLYYSFMRQNMNEDTMGAAIIFNMQQYKQQLWYDGTRCCPVDAGIIPIKSACRTCRKCFSKQVYNGYS